MVSRFEHRRYVAFAETDMAGIVHFSNYLRYVEEAEHALYRSLGLSVHAADASGGDPILWPRVDVGCTWRSPLRFEDEIATELVVAHKGRSSLRYLYVVRRLAPGGVVVAARGHLVIVCAHGGPDGTPLGSRPIPPAFDDALEQAEPAVIAAVEAL